jgi:hypothetical protein
MEQSTNWLSLPADGYDFLRANLKGCSKHKKFDKSMSLGSQIVFTCYNELVDYFKQIIRKIR